MVNVLKNTGATLATVGSLILIAHGLLAVWAWMDNSTFAGVGLFMVFLSIVITMLANYLGKPKDTKLSKVEEL